MIIPMTFPLYFREFGYDLDLHDARFLSVAVEDGAMVWRLRLYQAPAGHDRRDERAYEYRLRFTGYGGELDLGALAGSEIYRFAVTDSPQARVEVDMILLPSGATARFTCADIVEEELAPASP